MLLGNRMTAQHRAKGWADHAKKLLPRQLTETVLERQGKNGMKMNEMRGHSRHMTCMTV